MIGLYQQPYVPRLHEGEVSDEDRFKLSGALRRMLNLAMSQARRNPQQFGCLGRDGCRASTCTAER